MPLPAPTLPFVRMTNEDLPGAETYAHIDAYRYVWYDKNWRSIDDAEWDGPDTPPLEPPPWVLPNVSPYMETVLEAEDADEAKTLLEVTGGASGSDAAYSASGWNNSLLVPTQNAVRDKFEAQPTVAPGDWSTPATVGPNTVIHVAGSTDATLGRATGGNDLLLPSQKAVLDFIRNRDREVVLGSSVVYNNNNTLANVSGMSFSVEANSVYWLVMHGYYIASAAADLQIRFTGPASATMLWQSVGVPSNVAVSAGQGVTWRNHRTISEVGAFAGQGTTASDDLAFLAFGRLVTAGTAGTFQLQAAQFVAEATDATLLLGSAMRLQQVG